MAATAEQTMQSEIQISVVVPTYNRAHLVGRAIESVIAQVHAPSEIIVVDDGSLDDTRSVVKSYGQAVSYIYQANAGVSAARNRGVREAKCEWIAFLDSDDYWLPDHLSRIVRAIGDTHGAAAVYFADLQCPQEQGGQRYWHICSFEIEGVWKFARNADEWVFMRRQPMMLQASVLSRRAYMEVGGLPQYLRTREDTLLFYKLGVRYPACAVSGCGTVMHSDDSIRLTQVYDPASQVFQDATIFLYRELLAGVNNISAKQRQQLVGLLSEAHYTRGRGLIRRKNYMRAIKEMATACRVSPSRFIREVRGSMARHLFWTGNQ
jgi:glycosyltransferase involved in cell wall biosynthesis